MKEKRKIIIYISAFVLLAVGSTFIFFKTMKNNKAEPQKPFQTEEEKKQEQEVNEAVDKNETLSKEEKENLTKEEKEELAFGEYLGIKNSVNLLGKETNKEYGKEASKALYKELVDLAERASYYDIINRVDEVLKTHKFTEDYNWKICDIYLDANVMINAKGKTDKGQQGYMVSKLKDPYMLLIGTLMIPERERRDIITETGSLSPIFEGAVDITDSTVLNNETINDDTDTQAQLLFDTETSIYELYRINFKVNDNPLIAYIVRYANGVLGFKTIVTDGNYEHPYKPISYWMNLDKIIYGKETTQN